MKKLFYSVLAGLLLLPSVAFAALGTLQDNENNKFVLNSAGSVAVRVTTSGGNITMADDSWIGLGASGGRLVFDSTPSPDLLTFYNCTVAIDGLTATRVLFAGTGGAISDDAGFVFTAASDLLTLGENGQDGSLKIYSEQGTTDYAVTFQPAAAMTMNTTYTLPVDDGTTGQVLSTDGSGVLSWTASIPGSPAGSDTQVQYNNGGTAFGADAGFTYVAASDTLTLGENGQDGVLTLYSEQGGTDYSATINPNATMTSAAAFYLPADEPASTLPVTMTSGGVMGFNDQAVATSSSPTFANLTDSGITATHIVYGGASGLLSGSAIWTYDSGNVTMGNAAANGGVFSMIQGAVASDPTFSITQATNDVTIAQTVGDITLNSAGNDVHLGLDDDAVNLAIHSSGTLTMYEASDDFSASMNCKDGAAEFVINDDVNLGADDAGENLYIHSAGTLNVYEASDDFTASAQCKDGAAEWLFNDDVNVGGVADAENLYVHNGGAFQVLSAGDDKNIQINHDDTNAVITVSSGALNVNPDTDFTATIGRCKLGYNGASSDVFEIGHVDLMSQTGYALAQAAYDTYLNAHSSGSIQFMHNNVSIGSATDTQWELGNYPTDILFVDGILRGNRVSYEYACMESGDYLGTLTAPKVIYMGEGSALATSTEVGVEDASGLTWTFNGTVVGDKTFSGSAHVISFDGVDAYISTPDDASLSFASGAVSWGGWIEVVAGATQPTIISKWNEHTGSEDREWQVYLGSDEKLYLELCDESADATAIRGTDAALTAGLHSFIITYDGTNGATCLDGTNMVIYIDGASVALQSAAYVGTFDTMDAGSSPCWIGAIEGTDGNAGNFATGDMGRLFITAEELSATSAWKLYMKTRGYYNK